MVDLTFQLGRDVPTAREILEVIRPNLRLAAVIGPVVNAAMTGYAPHGEACLEGGDQAAYDAVTDALHADALSNVKDWAGDSNKVYDRDKLGLFVGEALRECMTGKPSDAVLDVLDLDEGVCENIGTTLNAVGALNAATEALVGMAARYFQRV